MPMAHGAPPTAPGGPLAARCIGPHLTASQVALESYPPLLYDLETDPHEMNDLAQQPEMAGVLTDCASLHLAHARSLCTPGPN